MPAAFERKASYRIEDLLRIMEILRSKEGCPWDREQDHHSIRKNFVEETYEACEAIDREDTDLLREDLGDVLLQIVFHARMEEEAGSFCFDDVCDGICKKLILRHPHVFGDTQVSGSGDVLVNWDRIKQESKGQKTAAETLRSVSPALPALMRSEKVQHRAAKVGFDYPSGAMALDDLASELDELREAVAENAAAHIDEELGDLLFAAVNVSRFAGIDAEESLNRACNKFIGRFTNVEQLAAQRGIDMKSSSIEKLDELWREAKRMNR